MNLEETGGFTSSALIAEAQTLTLDTLTLREAVAIGQFTTELADIKKLPVSIEVRLGQWCVYRICLEGAHEGLDTWINGKCAVVEHSQNSSLLELVMCEEQGVSWYDKHGLDEGSFAANGGAIPLKTQDSKLAGVLIVSGMAGPDDHRLAVSGVKAFKGRR